MGLKANLHFAPQTCGALELRLAGTVGRKDLCEICSSRGVLLIHSAEGLWGHLWPQGSGLTMLSRGSMPWRPT